MNKADTQESSKRLLQINDWLLDGKSFQQIIRYCADKWNIKERQVYNYIKKARQKWDEICNQQFESNLSWHLLTRERLYQKCIKKGDFSNARQVLDSLADIQGLRELRIKSEHTEKHEYHLIIERPETDSDNGNGRIETKIEQMAR